MIPDDFFAYRTVLVQGHLVTLTLELVNEYFHVPNFSEPDQDIGQQEAALHEHEQLEAQPQYDDQGMKGMKARLNTHLDVIEAGMIDMEFRLSTRIEAMVARMDKIAKTLHQTYARCQAGLG
ncbi:hypothetical protein ACOSQ4_021179 [Xanthoceras sorbifolium]